MTSISKDPSIFKIAFPVTIQALTGYAMLFTDQMFVGQVSFDNLTAVTNSVTPYFGFLSFFFALSSGVTILIAQALGASRPHRASRIAESALAFQFLVGIAYFLFWQLGARPILTAVGAQGHLLDLGVTFLSILCLQNLWMGPVLSAASVFQGQGRTTSLMVSAVVKNLVNIFLGWCLVFGNLGFPALGVPGSAWATVIADLIGSLLLLGFLKGQKGVRLSLRGIFKPLWRVYFQVLKVGIPAGLEFFLWQAGQVGLISMINRANEPLLAGFFGLMNTLLLFSVNLYIGLGTAATTLAGRATGEENPKKVLSVGLKTTLGSLVVCTLAGLLFFFFPQAILGLFDPQGDKIGALLPFMGVLILITFPKAVNVVIGSAIRGTGNTRWMLYTQAFGTIFILGLAGIFLFGLGWGLAALIWAVFWDEAVRGVINFGKFIHGLRKLARV